MWGCGGESKRVGKPTILVDPELEEFLHFETHPPDVPITRDVNGRFPVEADIGLVLVLIPGGFPGETFWMGAQKLDVAGDNYDPGAIVEEGWEQKREMPCPGPFLLSKYEMTRGQWYRLTGHNPSAGLNRSPVLRPAHPAKPVNKVSWEDCEKMMRRLGLILPDELQWEYAARAGTTTAFWTGQDASSLEGKELLFDLAARDEWPAWSPRWAVVPAPWYDKQTQQRYQELRQRGRPVGIGAVAPVGAYQPNGFGLYDVAGNLAEWTLLGPELEPHPLIHVLRGSSFKRGVKEARSASRRDATSDVSFDEVGLRPAMVIQR